MTVDAIDKTRIPSPTFVEHLVKKSHFDGAEGPNIEASVRKLQHVLAPIQLTDSELLKSGSHTTAVEVSNILDVKKVADYRSIQRLIRRISDGHLEIEKKEACFVFSERSDH